MEELFTTAAITSVFTLTLLEVILGVDNIIFISIIAGKLEPTDQSKARRLGLLSAMAIRVGLLFVLGFILGLEKDLFNLQDLGLPIDMGMSGKDMILLIGGVFLLYKATSEIHHKLEGEEDDMDSSKPGVVASLSRAVLDISVINVIFSIDSIITAIGMTNSIPIMAASVILSTIAMLLFAKNVGDFVEKHPTVKMLALSFLVMIGTLLVAEAFHVHVPKGYVYFAMAFSFLVEMLNIRMKKNALKPVELHKHVKED